MWIEDKRMSRRDRTLFVFEFESEEDKHIFFTEMHAFCYLFDGPGAKRFAELVHNLESRADDVYADLNKGVYQSSSLFQDEMADFSSFLCSMGGYLALAKKVDITKPVTEEENADT